MKMISKLDDNEIATVATQIDRLLLQNGIIYPDEFEQIVSHLGRKGKDALLQFIKKSKKYVDIDEEGILKYIPPKAYESVYSSESRLIDIQKPDYAHTTKDYFQIGRTFYKGFIVKKIPTNPKIDWLSKLVSERRNIDFAVFKRNVDLSELRLHLRKEMKEIENQQYKIEKGGRESPELEEKKKSLAEILRSLGKDYTEFKISIFIVVKGQTIEEIENLRSYLINSLKGDEIIVEEATFLHEYVVKKVIPNGVNDLPHTELLVTDEDAQKMYPYFHPFQDSSENDDLILGTNQSDLITTGNIWEGLDSYSGARIGITGGGKGIGVKNEIIQHLRKGDVQVIIVDPAASKVKDKYYKPEYYRLCKYFKGQYYKLSIDSGNIPNVMVIYPEEGYINAMLRIYTIIRTLHENEDKKVPEAQKPLCKAAVREAFKRRGITRKTKEPWKKKQPRLEDYLFALKKAMSKARSQDTIRSYESMIKRIEECVGDGLRSYLNNNKEQEDVNNRLTVFEFSDTPEDDMGILLMKLLSYVNFRRQRFQKTILLIDEAHIWLRNPYLAMYLEVLEATGRKTFTGLRLIFQNLAQLQSCKEGLSLLGNLAFVFLYKTKPELIPLTKETFGLNEAHCKVLVNSRPGEFIIGIWGNKKYKLKETVDPETYKIITTKPQEIQALQEAEDRERSEAAAVKILEEDLGYRPTSIETGLLHLSSKIKREPELKKLLNHYPAHYKKLLQRYINAKK